MFTFCTFCTFIVYACITGYSPCEQSVILVGVRSFTIIFNRKNTINTQIVVVPTLLITSFTVSNACWFMDLVHFIHQLPGPGIVCLGVGYIMADRNFHVQTKIAILSNSVILLIDSLSWCSCIQCSDYIKSKQLSQVNIGLYA